MKSRILLCILFLLSGNLLLGQTYNQLGSNINGVASDNLGGNVSISSDGNIMAIGSPGHIANTNDLSTGQVKVFELVNNDWVQKGPSLVGEVANDSYGSGLDISDDGNILVIGAPNSDGNGGASSFTGRIYIYEWSGSDWSLLQTLNGASGENFGSSISVSSDGSFLAAGAPNANGGGSVRGAVRVYQRAASTWNQVGNDVNGSQDSESAGRSVSLKVTGTDKVLAVGGPGYSSVPGNFDEAGVVRIYRESAGSWGNAWTGSETIIGTLNSAWGGSVDFSDNGSRLAVGAPNGLLAGDPNYVEVYEFNASSTPKWQVLGSRINSNHTNGDFGKNVGVSGDGSHLVVGAPASAGTGKENGYTKLFKFESSAWTELDSIPGAAANDEFGSSVAINADGSQYSVGAQGNDTGGDAAGQVQVYELFVPDVIAPTVTISSSAGAITNTNPLNITITFSEEVTGFEAADISVENATVGTLNTTDDIVYTAEITANQDGAYTVSIAADALTDVAGNGNEASNELTYTLDTQAPTAQVETLVTNNKRPVLTGTINDANATIQLTISGTSESLLTATNNGTTWELTASTISSDLSDGTYDVVLNVEDLAGNDFELTTEGALTVDATAPTITVEELLTNNPQPTISGTVSDALSGVASVAVLIDGNTIAATIDENNNWNAAVSADLAEGAYDITVTALDVAGNEATLTETDVITIDLTRPTVTITGVEEGSTIQSPDATTLTFTSSEEVTGFELADITVTNGSASNFISTNAPVYTADITPDAFGNITVTVTANAVQDGAGNVNEATTISYTNEQKYSGGSGTEADPYLIASEDDLRELSASSGDWGGKFLQTSNIHMSNELFNPIGNHRIFSFPGSIDDVVWASESRAFTGDYNGGGFMIFNLNCSNVPILATRLTGVNTVYLGSGLFGSLAGNVANLGLVNPSFSGSSEIFEQASKQIYAGFVAQTEGTAVIEKVFTQINTITNGFSLGGIVGHVIGENTIRNSYVAGTIEITSPNTATSFVDYVNIFLAAELLIENSYSLLRPTGSTNLFYPVSNFFSTPPIINNTFWDTELTGVDVGEDESGTGLSTTEMRKRETYVNAGWDLTNIWFHSGPGYHPVLKWQVDNAKPFTVSGKVLDKDGEPFSAGTAKALFFILPNKTVDLAEDGSFTLEDIPGFIHSIVIEPDAGETEHVKTFYGDANRSTLSRHVYNSVSGIQIQMIAKPDQNQLTGNGVVNGRVVDAGTGTGRIVQGRILDGEGLEGVTVFLVRTSDEEILTQVQTDANGDFEITGIPAGEYQLLLDVVGIDVNLEGSTFTMDEEGSELTISAAVSEEGITFAIEEVLGIENEIEVSVYPNPVRDFVNVQIPGKAVARIIDVNGTVLKEESFTDNLKLNISELHSNMYFLEITNAKGKAMKKLVKN